MQNWTFDMWHAASIGLALGILLGYTILRFGKGSVKKHVQTEAKLVQLKSELASQRQQLEKHFAESADLLRKIADDYQNLYNHFAAYSTSLLSEIDSKELFTNPLTHDTHGRKEPTFEIPEEKQPPRDYPESSSGIFKAEKY